MEFLSLSRRHSSLQNIPSDEERGETAVFVGYPKCCSWVTGKTFFLKIIILLDTLDFRGAEHWSLHDFSHNTALIVTGQIKFWLKKILLFLEVKLFGLLTLKMQYFIILRWLTLGVLNLEQNMMNGAQRLRVNYYCGFYYLTSAQSVDSQNWLKTVGYWSWMYFSPHMDTR